MSMRVDRRTFNVVIDRMPIGRSGKMELAPNPDDVSWMYQPGHLLQLTESDIEFFVEVDELVDSLNCWNKLEK